MKVRSTPRRAERVRSRLSLTGVIIALSVGVILPVILASSVGIVALAMGESSTTMVIGILTTSFTASAIGGAVVVTVLLGRRARLARMQADLLANMTHELRTPIAAIRMYTQTLQMGLVDNDSKRRDECVATILRETEWLESMVDRVLTWRGAAKDRDALNFETLSVSETVGEAVTHFRRMIKENDLTLDLHLDAVGSVRHDRAAIASVLLNLLINAYKYSGSDKRISVLTRDESAHVVLEVRDNGIGIGPKELGRIFEPFYRVDAGLRSRSTGTGLGLAIVKHQVEMHGGTVTVKSEKGSGSRFIVRLPRAEEKEESR